MDIPTFQNHLLQWFIKRNKIWPWRSLWRQDRDPYPVWVSEIMLQQTTIPAVLPVYERFLETFPTVLHLAQASEEALRKGVQGLGYYRRFFLMQKAARIIVSERNALWPDSFESWLELPGIGEYTASMLASITLGVPEPAVDGNIERVMSRLLALSEPMSLGQRKKWFRSILKDWICQKNPGLFNEAIMEVGQDLCVPGPRPACGDCPISGFCLAYKSQQVHLCPPPKVKEEKIPVDLSLTIFEKSGGIGLVRRDEKARFLKLQEGFLTEESPSGDYLGGFSHSITKHKLQVRVYRSSGESAGHHVRWVLPEEVDGALISNLDRKAWRIYQKQKP
jgi:A/G-specific adenine glycosylase